MDHLNSFFKSINHSRVDYTDEITLATACADYFMWCDKNPLWEDKVQISKGEVYHTPISKARMYLLESMFDHIRITQSDWDNYRVKFPTVTDWVENRIYAQKVTGAASNFFNTTIAARSAGLREKQQHELTGAEGERLYPEFDASKLSTEALLEIMKARNTDGAD